jgi:hypothetical protein
MKKTIYLFLTILSLNNVYAQFTYIQNIIMSQNATLDSTTGKLSLKSTLFFLDAEPSHFKNGFLLFEPATNYNSLQINYHYTTQQTDSGIVSLLAYSDTGIVYREDFVLLTNTSSTTIPINHHYFEQGITFRIALFASGYYQVLPNSILEINELQFFNSDELGSAKKDNSDNHQQKNTTTPVPISENQFLLSESPVILVYPNPNSGVFNIETHQETFITIKNMLGQLVYQQTIYNNTQIDLSGYDKGIYILDAMQDKKPFRTKLILE